MKHIIFYGKNYQGVKLLRWDTDGFVLYQKRLEKGTFEIPKFDEVAGGFRMPWKTFSMIMQGVSLRSARYRKRFKIEVWSKYNYLIYSKITCKIIVKTCLIVR